MKSFLEKLRGTPVNTLKDMYTQDPDFTNNVAIGQSLYYKVAEKYGAKKIIPSRNDLTDGLLADL